MLPTDAHFNRLSRQALRARTLLFAALIACLGCQSQQSPSSAPGDETQAPLFMERGAALGVDFVQQTGMSGEFYFPEIMGGGVALFDYDNDGDLDLYLVQGGSLGPDVESAEGDRLYRNEIVPSGELRFIDVTEQSGLHANSYGMAVSVGDDNGDGWLDLYLSSFGSNQLWRNLGNGQFVDLTDQLGVGDENWGAGAAFIDIDADGDEDLVAINYVDFRFNTHKECFNTRSAIDYCSPKSYPAKSNRLWENLGGGRFQDRSDRINLPNGAGASLGLLADDFNGDGRIDLYIANDGAPNRLWLNDGEFTFSEKALLSGCAVNRSGEAEASMGIDAADFDEDGDLDLFMTHLTDETNTLYVNDGAGWFDDATQRLGLGSSSRAWTGFGTTWSDLNLDGWVDLVVANGAVFTIEEQQASGAALPFRQPNQLFLSDRAESFDSRYLEQPSAAGVSRGLAAGDIDNDGDIDLVVQNLGERPSIWINQLNPGGNWLGLIVTPGTTVQWKVGNQTHRRTARNHGSYASAGDPRLLIPVDAAVGSPTIYIRWPDGVTAQSEGLEPGRYHTLVAPGPTG
jgi:hypothetical protein